MNITKNDYKNKKPEILVIILDKDNQNVIAERSTGYWGEIKYITNLLKKDYENYIKQEAKNKS